jgi:hypothetical protein
MVLDLEASAFEGRLRYDDDANYDGLSAVPIRTLPDKKISATER